VLLGVVGSNGLVGYVRPRLEIDASFVEEAKKGRPPEKRFRFAGPCVEGRCAQWTGSRCGVIDMAVEEQEAGRVPTVEGDLPKCSIRGRCRWFAQMGARACHVCPLVVTDARQA
jgi:hypothetical protein